MMVKNGGKINAKTPIYAAIISGLLVFSICILFLGILNEANRQKQSLLVAEHYMSFESKIERLIYSNIYKLQGYEAYIMQNPDIDEKTSKEYLDYLLSDNSEYIRNIGIIKDTTIQWNYPRESNDLAIGVDLAKIENQKEYVLRVKNELKPILHGPIDLVQGGKGFSVRLPLVHIDTGYWGQMSIVLKYDELIGEIERLAEESDIKIAVYSNENRGDPFFNNIPLKHSSVMNFILDPAFIDWTVDVSAVDAYAENLLLKILLYSVFVIISLAASIFVCKYIKRNNKILNMSTKDFLTGLYNRHFLDEYQTMILSAAKRENRKAAIIMVDLNDFKGINDTYGHNVGDKVLIETARVLKKVTRLEELVFRLGGDEFLIIIPNIDNNQNLDNIKRRLTEQFEDEFIITDSSIKINFSLGYACFPEDGESIDELLRAADKWLYKEKSKRKTK